MEHKSVFKKCEVCGHVEFSKCPTCGFMLLWRDDGVVFCANCGFVLKGLKKEFNLH